MFDKQKQRVVINGKSSNLAPVISAIPQGSVLGPILFLIYVNDLPEMARSKLKLFADDTKLYKSIKDVADKEILQTDLNSLIGWSNKWQLPFNIGKCKLLHLGTENPEFQYILTNGNETSTLEEVEKEKDLGIVFDNRLHFEQHVSDCTTKARQRIGLIKRNFKYLDESITITNLDIKTKEKSIE